MLLKHWGTALLTLILPATVAAVVGLVWGITIGLITLCFWLVLALWSERQKLFVFDEWLNSPKATALPTLTSSWDRVLKSFVKIQKRQRATETELSRALDRFEQAARALPDGVIVLNNANQIDWCNTKAEEYFRLTLARDRNVKIDYLLRHPSFRTFIKALNPEDTLTLRLPRSGLDRLISIQTIPFGNKQALLLARDITEREQLEITRRDFVANISHELRTPLTVIQGFLETFDDNPAENPQLLSRGVKLMSDQSHRMNRLITDLLALSRLETSNAPPEEVIYMSKLIDDVRTEGQALSTSNHEFEIQALPDLNILGAEDEIRSAVSNLVSNAVRYSPAGGKISIVWSLINGEPVFSCEDQGVGIPLEHLGRITERFYRVDKSRSQETGGTGLGLAIVKHVLNRHGATLLIDSEPRRGSKFTIHFLTEKIAPQKSLFS